MRLNSTRAAARGDDGAPRERPARGGGGGRPSTGRVLVMASSPTFAGPGRDSLDFAATGRTPVVNRATQARYAPGSTFKLVTAAAALDGGTARGHVPGPADLRARRPGAPQLRRRVVRPAHAPPRAHQLDQHDLRPDRRRARPGRAARPDGPVRLRLRPPDGLPADEVGERPDRPTARCPRTRPSTRRARRSARSARGHAAADGARGGRHRQRRAVCEPTLVEQVDRAGRRRRAAPGAGGWKRRSPETARAR